MDADSLIIDTSQRSYTVVDHWILDLDATIAEKMLLIVLRRYAWQGRPCHPSIRRIAQDMSVSVATVHRTLAALIQRGLVEVRSGAQRGRPSVYILHGPDTAQTALPGRSLMVREGVSHGERGVSHGERGVSHGERGVSHGERGVSHGERQNNTQEKTQETALSQRESEILARWREVWGGVPRRIDDDTIDRMDQMLGMHATGQLDNVRRPVAYLRAMELQDGGPRWSAIHAERRVAAQRAAQQAREARQTEEAILAAERAARAEWAAMSDEERARWRGYAHWRAMRGRHAQ